MRKHGWIAAGAVLMLLFHTSPGYPQSGNPEESLDAATLRNELRQLKEKVKELEDRLTEMEAAGAVSSGVGPGDDSCFQSGEAIHAGGEAGSIIQPGESGPQRPVRPIGGRGFPDETTRVSPNGFEVLQG